MVSPLSSTCMEERLSNQHHSISEGGTATLIIHLSTGQIVLYRIIMQCVVLTRELSFMSRYCKRRTYIRT